MLWLASPVTKDRTTADLCASFARSGNVEPYVTPGSDVWTSPVTLRIPDGAPILGSNVSVWGGPPCMNRNTTDRPVSRLSGSADRAAATSASESPPKPRVPTLRNSRRLQAGSRKLSMRSVPPAYGTRPKGETGGSFPVYSSWDSIQENEHADPTRPSESHGLRRRGLEPARLGPDRGKDPARRGLLFAPQFQEAPGDRDGESLRDRLCEHQIDAPAL